MDQDVELERLLAEYLETAEAGNAPPVAQFVDSHPRYRNELLEFFALRREIDAVASPFRAAAEQPVHSLSDSPGGPVSFGRYLLIGELGRGGMGVVYRARLDQPTREVALKVIGAGRLATKEDRLRFRIEVEAVSRLSHPSIVPVHDIGEVDGHPYYTMPVLAGGDLSAHQLRLEALPAEAARIVRELAVAVHHAHQYGVLHRDLKPSNILFDEAGRPYVSDFGLAKLMTESVDLTHTGQFPGTPPYMSPEQANSAPATAMTDVYGLGGVMYFTLTGHSPFEGSERGVLLDRVRGDDPISPRRWNPTVPQDLEAVCLKCLAKSPNRRYTSSAALAADLDNFLSGRPTIARPVGVIERLVRWVWRKPAPAALIAITVFALVVLPPAMVWYQSVLSIAQQSAAEAVLEQERAFNAQTIAENDRKTALKIAATQELYSLISSARRRALEKPIGWTRANRADLRRAAERALGDSGALTEVRSQAVTALLAYDLRPLDPIGPGFSAFVLAASPVGSVVALGEFRAPEETPRRVLLVDSGSGLTVRELKVPAGVAYHKPGLKGPDGVRSLVFTPDGRRLFVGTRSSRVYRFDLMQPEDLPSIGWQAFTTSLECLAVSRDGKSVYGADNDNLVRWDAENGKELARFHASGELGSSANRFVEDPWTGDILIHGRGRLFRLDALRLEAGNQTGKVAGTGHRLAFAPGGRVLIHGDALCDPDPAAGYEETARLVDPRLRSGAHESWIRVLAVHPSRPLLATAATFGDDRLAKVWELWSGRLIGSVQVPGTLTTSLVWSADGRFLLASASDQTLRWELIAPAAEQVTPVQAQPVESATFVDKGMRVATVCKPTYRAGGRHNGGRSPWWISLGPGHDEGKETRWLAADTPGGQPGQELLFYEAIGNERAGITAPPGAGYPIVTRGNGEPVAWMDDIVKSVIKEDLRLRCARYSSDGSVVWAVVGTQWVTETVMETVMAWDATTRAVRGRWTNDGPGAVSGLASLEALATGRTRTVAAGPGGTVFLLNEKVELVSHFPGPGDPVLCVAITPDESAVLAGTQGGRVRVIPLSDGNERVLPDAHTGGVTAVAVSRDGSYLATGGKDQSVKVWRGDGKGGYGLLFEAAGLAGSVGGLEFARDADRLLVRLNGEHSVRVWDIGVLRGQLAAMGLDW